MDPLLSTVHQLLSVPDEMENLLNNPTRNNATRTCILDTNAMASTPADVKEFPNSYVFIIDMPGLKSNNIKVQLQDENVLTISGE
ncbi:hypothetical protein SUGI_0624440 [Cryptomeria japonica]|nr:hypothetical protein SUGI_0624440 [Cryptomeria japonica]